MSEDKISMNHGAGGEVMANLISSAVLDNITKKSVNGGISLDALDDGATIPIGDYEIVVTTDGHTIDPLFFPGGDIGRISAAGTINDVSVMGNPWIAVYASEGDYMRTLGYDYENTKNNIWKVPAEYNQGYPELSLFSKNSYSDEAYDRQS